MFTSRKSIFCYAALLIIAALPLDAAEFSDRVKRFIVYDSPVIAIEHARLIDGTGTAPLDGQTLVIENGRIAALGGDGTIDLPPEAKRIDASGKTLLPGLVMVHEHFIYPARNLGYNHQGHSFPPLYLAAGATTVRTAGGLIQDKIIKIQIDAGEIPGPKIVLTGPHINGADMKIWRVSETPEEAARVVSVFADDGFPWAKAYMHLDRAQLRAVMEEARATGTLVTGHLCKVTYAEAAGMGIHNLEHGFLAATDFIEGRVPDSCDSSKGEQSLLEHDVDSPELQALFKTLIDNKVAITSTNTVFETFTPGRPSAYPEALSKLEPSVRNHYYQRWSAVAHNHEDSYWDELFAHNMKLEYEFAKAGGLLVVGTDPTGYGGVIAGYANHRALELLVEAGFSVTEAIGVATMNGARLLRMDDSIGSLKAGKVADLILVNGDVATDIGAIRKTEIVFKDGIGYDSKALFDSIEGTVGLH